MCGAEGCSETDFRFCFLFMYYVFSIIYKTSTPSSVSQFLPTSRKIVQFSNGKEPKPTDVVVYVDGGFDLFHVGHVEFLKKAKELGSYLLVGVHDDAIVNAIHGSNYPIMNVRDRGRGFGDELTFFIISCD